MTAQSPDQHVFILRARREPREVAGAPAEWRFWVEHLPSGDQRHYRDFAGVLEFVSAHLPAAALERVIGPPAG